MNAILSVAVLATLMATPTFADDLTRTHLEEGTEMFAGCQGEGCGCTNEKVSDDGFVLYKHMNDNSPIVGRFGRKTSARYVQAFSVVRNQGDHRVTKVEDKALGVKIGDRLFNVYNLGEGMMKARLGARVINFDQGQIEYDESTPTEIQEWHLIIVGNTVGYSKSMPFRGCLG